MGGPRSGAYDLGTAWNAPTNLSLPLLALTRMYTVLRTALATVNRSPRILLVMDSGPGSCLFCNSCTTKAYSNTGSLIDCVYSGQKGRSDLTTPVRSSSVPWKGAVLPRPRPIFFSPSGSLLSHWLRLLTVFCCFSLLSPSARPRPLAGAVCESVTAQPLSSVAERSSC